MLNDFMIKLGLCAVPSPAPLERYSVRPTAPGHAHVLPRDGNGQYVLGLTKNL